MKTYVGRLTSHFKSKMSLMWDPYMLFYLVSPLIFSSHMIREQNFRYFDRNIDKYLHRNFILPIFSDISSKFSDFSLFFPFVICLQKCFWRVSNPLKMPESGTFQPPSHLLYLLYIVQTFFIFSYYLFVHNPLPPYDYNILFYFYFTL